MNMTENAETNSEERELKRVIVVQNGRLGPEMTGKRGNKTVAVSTKKLNLMFLCH